MLDQIAAAIRQAAARLVTDGRGELVEDGDGDYRMIEMEPAEVSGQA
jgi:hypothetical protein